MGSKLLAEFPTILQYNSIIRLPELDATGNVWPNFYKETARKCRQRFVTRHPTRQQRPLLLHYPQGPMHWTTDVETGAKQRGINSCESSDTFAYMDASNPHPLSSNIESHSIVWGGKSCNEGGRYGKFLDFRKKKWNNNLDYCGHFCKRKFF